MLRIRQLPAYMIALSTAMLACATPGRAQVAPFIKHGFEENEGGWVTFGMGTKGVISRTSEAADVKEGKSALSFAYKVEKGTMAALLLPTPNGDLAQARSFRFWIKTD